MSLLCIRRDSFGAEIESRSREKLDVNDYESQRVVERGEILGDCTYGKLLREFAGTPEAHSWPECVQTSVFRERLEVCE